MIPFKPIPRRRLQASEAKLSFRPAGSSYLSENPGASKAPVIVPTPGSEAPAYEFLGTLPESYGTHRLFLVARDPYVLFAYWDLTTEQYQEATRSAKDGKIFLEIYEVGGDRVAQIHVWGNHHNWYLALQRPDTAFQAQLGYYQEDGSFTVLARSSEIRSPRDSLSPNTEVRFVTLPFEISFQELWSYIITFHQAGEELAETLTRLQQSNVRLPFKARLPRALTSEEKNELLQYLAEGDRQELGNSFDISEMLHRRFEALASSELWSTSVSSPFGASFGRERDFHLHLNAELIIYGGTEPTAKVRIAGQDIPLRPDGTFSYHFVFPDGQFHIPVEATSADEVETRDAFLSFLRMTLTSSGVKKTGQPPLPEPRGRIN